MKVNWKHFKYCRIMYYTDAKTDDERRALKRGNWRAYNSVWLVKGYMLDLYDSEVQEFLRYLRSTFEPDYKVEDEYKPTTTMDKIYRRLFFKK